MIEQSEEPTVASPDEEAQQRLAERFAPVLVMWPEIPAVADAPDSLRRQFERRRLPSASRIDTGAHITRDFYPRDVRIILEHAQAWEPRPPFPLMPIGLTRLYRDFARYFFWPIIAAVTATMLIVALAQSVDGSARTAVEIGALVFLGALYLLTLRSPILTPVDYWHHLNHLLIVAGIVTVWLATFGTGELWYVGVVVAVPSLSLLVTSLIIRATGERVANFAIWPIRWLRSVMVWILNRRGHARLRLHQSRVIQGVKPAHEYGEDGELFYRHPGDGKPMHRSNRESFWSGYSRILARQEERYPVTCYARVLEPNSDGVEAIQYWFCYYYDDWANQHEGDWEEVVVMLRDGSPISVAASAHEGGETRDWEHVEQHEGRPVLYVAAGSHAFFFREGAFLAERAVAGLRVTSVDAALLGKHVLDYVDFTAHPPQREIVDQIRVVFIPEPDPETGLWGHPDHDPDCHGDCAYNFEWLNYEGHWGSVGVSLAGGISGPRGPAASGLPWQNPYLWSTTACRPCSECHVDD